MTVCRSFLLIFMLILSHLVRAEFVELPKVSDFSEVENYKEAMHRLFQGRGQDFKKIRIKGGQTNRAYSAVFDGADWFVKIIREDCDECELMRFEFEWSLKKNLHRYRWLANVNAELVLPDRAATFMLNHKQHYILSYPLVTGKTLSALYNQHYLASPYALGTIQQTLLDRAFYRFGQVLALSHLDPARPAKNRAEMLSRVVRLDLPDRNGSNEIYDPESDRIYLVDLAGETEDFGGPVKVGEALGLWLSDLVEMVADAHQEEIDCGHAYDCIESALKPFSLGYASALPLYERTMIIDMIRSTMTSSLREECDNEMQGDSFCSVVDVVDQQFLSPDIS